MHPFEESYNYVMIIDDSEMDIMFLKQTLNHVNYANYFSTFKNPFTALAFMRSCVTLPDLIFIDINMPGMNGFEFIEHFTKEFDTQAKFIIISSSDDKCDIEKSRHYPNIIQYIIKPIGKVDFIQLNQAG
jgi:two-component SAPR family response regulator